MDLDESQKITKEQVGELEKDIKHIRVNPKKNLVRDIITSINYLNNPYDDLKKNVYTEEELMRMKQNIHTSQKLLKSVVEDMMRGEEGEE